MGNRPVTVRQGTGAQRRQDDDSISTAPMSTSLPEAPSADTVSADHVAMPALSAEALTRALLGAALDCVIVIDGQGLVLEWNEAATRTFGYEREQALGVELAELIIPERLRAAHRDGMARYLATSEPRVLGRRIETEAMRADGSELPVELAITQVDDRPLPVRRLPARHQRPPPA